MPAGRGLDGLDPAELAAVASSVLYEARRDDAGTPRIPDGPVAAALETTSELWTEMVARERELGLPPSREPDAGFAWAAYRWARGDGLERVLRASDLAGNPLPAGDFVRWCRQLIDLLEQLAARPGTARGPGSVAAAARAACDALRRGVVAQSLAG